MFAYVCTYIYFCFLFSIYPFCIFCHERVCFNVENYMKCGERTKNNGYFSSIIYELLLVFLFGAGKGLKVTNYNIGFSIQTIRR